MGREGGMKLGDCVGVGVKGERVLRRMWLIVGNCV